MNKTEHLLTCLAEECAEVAQATCKALRFGLDDGYPGSGQTNAQDISRELADLLAVVEMIEEAGLIPPPRDPERLRAKQDKVRRFMAYASERGTLID